MKTNTYKQLVTRCDADSGKQGDDLTGIDHPMRVGIDNMDSEKGGDHRDEFGNGGVSCLGGCGGPSDGLLAVLRQSELFTTIHNGVL